MSMTINNLARLLRSLGLLAGLLLRRARS